MPVPLIFLPRLQCEGRSIVFEIVFIHGIKQEGKDPDQLKAEWIEYLNQGLAGNDPPLPPIDPEAIRFPYYGDTLKQLAEGRAFADIPDVLLRGDLQISEPARRFLFDVLEEIRIAEGFADDAISDMTGVQVAELGPENWRWVRAILQRLDENPQISAKAIALIFYSVFQYLTNGVVRARIDAGVAQAFTSGKPTIVVGHSLGSIVAYTLLLREGQRRNLNVPLLITLGSPLAINAIRERAPDLANVGGNRIPECVRSWLNGMDPTDVVALRPLTPEYFRLSVPGTSIDNIEIDNRTSNHHGIGGYLNDPRVAKRIYDAAIQQP